jgi:SAM-dependent methyltransferase
MASEITINDTRDFHRYEKPGHIHTEATFAYVMSINRDRASSGEPYGKILAAKLHRELKPEHNKPLQIAEVGPGNGQPAASFLIGLAIEHDALIRYKAIELSPNLIKSSRLSAPDFQTQISEYVAIEYLEGDAHSLVDFLEADSLDMFIANEMVGDMLTIDNVPRSMLTGEMDIQSAGLAPKIADCVADVRRIIGTYDLPVPDRERVAYNYGALLLVEQAFSRIKPGGVLFLSEHSSEIPFPVVASVAHEYSGIAGKSMAI